MLSLDFLLWCKVLTYETFVSYYLATEDDKWSQEQVKFIYISGRTTGRGDALAGSGGAAPLAVKVEAGKDLKLMLIGQTGIFPAYLHLHSLDITTNPAEATMALPPFSLGTKELGLVVGCNLADLSVSIFFLTFFNVLNNLFEINK